jgi:hypothetical protein
MIRFIMACAICMGLYTADMAAGSTEIICGQNQWTQTLAPNVQACYRVTTSKVFHFHSSEWAYSIPKEEMQ